DLTRSQDFEIRRNPSVAGATDADLQSQFALARQISERVSDANRAVVRIRTIKEQIADRLIKASDASLKSAGLALVDRLTAVEGEIYQHRLRSGQDPLNYPIRLNNKLAALQGTVESGDDRPTDQARAVFKELSGRLDRELGRLESLVNTELAAFNKSLEGAGQPAVKGRK
nr:glycosyl hydrolase [Acidobacteriota bacterium]